MDFDMVFLVFIMVVFEEILNKVVCLLYIKCYFLGIKSSLSYVKISFFQVCNLKFWKRILIFLYWSVFFWELYL